MTERNKVRAEKTPLRLYILDGIQYNIPCRKREGIDSSAMQCQNKAMKRKLNGFSQFHFQSNAYPIAVKYAFSLDKKKRMCIIKENKYGSKG